jgi:hypothetical protein
MKPPSLTQRTTPELSEHVDGAQARRLLSLLRGDLRSELALVGVGQFAVRSEAELAGDHHQVARSNERHIVGDRSRGFRKGDAEFLKPGVHRAHVTLS